MDIENLKNIWQNQTTDSTAIEEIINSPSYHNPLRRIKKNMICECLFTWLSIGALIFILYRYQIGLSEHISTIAVLLGIGIIFTLLLHIRFYFLYQKMNFKVNTTFHSLIKFKYELNSALHLYRIGSYVMSLFVIPVTLIIMFKLSFISIKFTEVQILQWIQKNFLYILLNIFAFVFIATEIVLYLSYGMYVKRINKLIDKLDSDVE